MNAAPRTIYAATARSPAEARALARRIIENADHLPRLGVVVEIRKIGADGTTKQKAFLRDLISQFARNEGYCDDDERAGFATAVIARLDLPPDALRNDSSVDADSLSGAIDKMGDALARSRETTKSVVP